MKLKSSYIRFVKTMLLVLLQVALLTVPFQNSFATIHNDHTILSNSSVNHTYQNIEKYTKITQTDYRIAQRANFDTRFVFPVCPVAGVEKTLNSSCIPDCHNDFCHTFILASTGYLFKPSVYDVFSREYTKFVDTSAAPAKKPPRY